MAWGQSTYQWLPGAFQGDAASAQSNAWRNVFDEEELGKFSRAIEAMRMRGPNVHLDPELVESLGALACMDTLTRNSTKRGSCKFHIIHGFYKNRSQLFRDHGAHGASQPLSRGMWLSSRSTSPSRA